jgi:O-antigen/teichoic acid export membrane protein
MTRERPILSDLPDATPDPIRSDAPGARSAGITRRIYGNLGKLLGGKSIAGLVSLLYMVIALRVLGPRDYGVLILVHTYTITVGGIIEFPGWHAVVRYGAQAANASDLGRLVRLLRLTGGLELACGAVAVVIAAAAAPYFGPRLGWSPEAMAFATPYSFAVLATIRSAPAGYLQLMGRFDLLGAHNLVSPLIRLIGALIVLALDGGLHGFLVAWLVAALAEWAAMWLLGWWVARDRLAGIRLLGTARGAIHENPGIWRFMIAANTDITFGELAQRIAPLAVGWVMGPVSAAIYAVGQRATSVIAQPAGNLGQAAYAELARLIAAGGSGADVRAVVGKSVTIALAIAVPLLILVACFGRSIAELLGGSQFRTAGPIMVWLFAARTVLLVAPPATAALVAMGKPGRSVVANMLCSLGLLPLLPLLMMHFGLPGAGVHALITAVGVAIVLVGFLWRESRLTLPGPRVAVGVPEQKNVE